MSLTKLEKESKNYITRHLGVIAENVRRLRGKMTQVQFAQTAGISNSTLQKIEAGKSVELDNLLRVAKALNINPADLFLSDEDRNEITKIENSTNIIRYKRTFG